MFGGFSLPLPSDFPVLGLLVRFMSFLQCVVTIIRMGGQSFLFLYLNRSEDHHPSYTKPCAFIHFCFG